MVVCLVQSLHPDTTFQFLAAGNFAPHRLAEYLAARAEIDVYAISMLNRILQLDYAGLKQDTLDALYCRAYALKEFCEEEAESRDLDISQIEYIFKIRLFRSSAHPENLIQLFRKKLMPSKPRRLRPPTNLRLSQTRHPEN
jgi:hypothetical protein